MRRLPSITVPALAFDLHAQRVLHVLDRQAVAAGGQPVDHHAQVLHAVVLDRVDVLVARHLLHQLLDLPASSLSVARSGPKTLIATSPRTPMIISETRMSIGWVKL
jgi:hypothetical protein